MKRLFIILLISSLFINNLNCQTLIQQIEYAYSVLDSISYIENIVLSFTKVIEKQQNEMDKTTLELYGFDYDSMDIIQRHDALDSINYVRENSKYVQTERTENMYSQINQFGDKIRVRTPVYVLNLIPKNDRTLQVDTGKLSFNLFYFDKNYRGDLYIYCKEGEYSWQDVRYRTFSKKLGVNAPKVFRKIMQKQPKYLLYCSELEGMNTILYVLNSNVYIYRIIQMQEYKLSDYIEKFGIIK